VGVNVNDHFLTNGEMARNLATIPGKRSNV
jgi:hypothetical protein